MLLEAGDRGSGSDVSQLLRAILEAQRTGQRVALATVVHSQGSVPRHPGAKMLVYPDGRILGSVGGGELERRVLAEGLEALRSGDARVLRYALSDPAAGDPGTCGGQAEVFVEPIQPPPTLVVVGGGHVGRAVVQLGKFLGFRVVLSDDRAEFCSAQNVPGADEYLLGPMADLADRVEIGRDTYIVLTTRGLALDVEGLPALLAKPAAYIGVIGSRRRWLTAAKELEARGVRAEAVARVHSPMGLELNAETPEEIAVSILAEIISGRRGGTSQPMSSAAGRSGEASP
ncbi:MAG: XdhC family protein [Anaerolineales bacterium]